MSYKVNVHDLIYAKIKNFFLKVQQLIRLLVLKLITYFNHFMTLPLVLYLVGVLGFTLNRRNLLILIVSIELMLLRVTLLILISAHDVNDAIGQVFAALIVSVAGAESAIGLGVLVAYYRLRGTVTLSS